MNYIEILKKELEKESQTTRNILKRIPDDKFNWQPHVKSMTLIRLATHVAELPGWIPMVLETDELDFATSPYAPKVVINTEELVKYFEETLEVGKKALSKADENQFKENWTLREGDTIYDVSPKGDVIRMAFSQIIHHRAQLGVYLRLLNTPIPGSYGPSADEQ